VTSCTTIDGVGGVNYENFYDSYTSTGGQNQSLASFINSAYGPPTSTNQEALLTGQWRVGFRTTASQSPTEMLFVITVDATGTTAPTYSYAQAKALIHSAPGVPNTMPGISQYWSGKVVNLTTGKNTLTAPTLYAAAFTTVPTDANTGGVEVSSNGYARHQMAGGGADWNAAILGSPTTATNANDITWPVSTGSWGVIAGIGFFDAATNGNLIMSDYLGNGSYLPFTCNSASPGVFTCEGHGFSNNDVVAATTKYGGAFPTLSQGSFAGLLTVQNVTTNTFTLTTSGAVALNTSSVGSGSVKKVTTVNVNASGDTFRIAAGQLTIAFQ